MRDGGTMRLPFSFTSFHSSTLNPPLSLLPGLFPLFHFLQSNIALDSAFP